MIKYRVAHVNRKGADLIYIPLDPSIAQRPIAEQAELLRTLQRCANSAGLKGSVVLVWEKGGGNTGLLAEKTVHPHIQGTTLAFVQSNVNRELTVKGLSMGYSLGVSPGPGTPGSGAGAGQAAGAARPEEKATFGFLSIASETASCEAYIDSKFIGNLPVKRVKLAEGVHSVQVKRSGYKDFNREVMMTEGAEISLQAQLEAEDTLFFGREGATESQKSTESGDKLMDFQRKHRVALVTILFTDIVGSTKLKQEMGDREAVRMIQWHHGLVRGLLKSIPGGEEINTQGDSFFLVFVKPSDAVKFALLLQAQLRAAVEKGGYPLYDRVGIHVGEVFVEEEVGGAGMNDLYGIQVDTSARVMSLAEASQILMTRFAFDNARQVLKGQEIEGIGKLVWINHGYYSLKGVEEPIEICEVGEEGLGVLKAPADSDKVHRVNASGQPIATESDRKAAARPPAAHVVVSSKPTQQITTLRPGGFSSFPKGGSS
ncbi:MAG: PEGA domain-containing protein [Verrucomicrobia bacterium]|nr:PEGA domain-containing protein [Verrucomicrobiota bacterium]